MLVELDIFSGRPNPRWELDERRGNDLRQLQRRLETSPGPPVEPPALGYRGFCWSAETGPVRVYAGYVITPGGIAADPAFSLERYLLGQLPAEYAGLRRQVAAVLGDTGGGSGARG